MVSISGKALLFVFILLADTVWSKEYLTNIITISEPSDGLRIVWESVHLARENCRLAFVDQFCGCYIQKPRKLSNEIIQFRNYENIRSYINQLRSILKKCLFIQSNSIFVAFKDLRIENCFNLFYGLLNEMKNGFSDKMQNSNLKIVIIASPIFQ